MIGKWLCRRGRHKMVEELGLGALSIWSCERLGCGYHHVVSNWGQSAGRITRTYEPVKLTESRRKGWAIPPESPIWGQALPERDSTAKEKFRREYEGQWPPPVKPDDEWPDAVKRTWSQ